MGRAKSLGHVQIHNGKMKEDDPEIATSHDKKVFGRWQSSSGKNLKMFIDNIRTSETSSEIVKLQTSRSIPLLPVLLPFFLHESYAAMHLK